MKKRIKSILSIGLFISMIIGIMSFNNPKSGNYVLLAWNNLGMHCSNKYFGNIAILPPFNNVIVQAIKKGSSTNLPQVVTTDLKVSYEVPGNTWSGNATDSLQKTDFWKYASHLFNANLSSNIGLTGVGLKGFLTQQPNDNFFFVNGIPLTPYQDNDLVNESPYQLGLFKLYDNNNNLLATTQNVIPVSNEISCVSSNCHSSEANILSRHINEVSPSEGGFSLADKPILCARCHADNALGTTGIGEAPPLSQAVHSLHGEFTNDCYKCHPGIKTKCLRDTMFSLGKICQDCHGSVANVGATIAAGRRPWLDEPTCGTCHGANYATEPGKLYRESKGHGGLLCSACHGSPHALVSTVVANDNVQNISWQGYKGTLSRCVVCHGVYPQGPGPHGLMPKFVVEGNVNYDNVSKTPITKAVVNLRTIEGTIINTKTTNKDGYFQFPFIPQGKYTIDVFISKLWGGGNPTDALLILKNFVLLYEFSDNIKKHASDVDNNGNTTATDALDINRRFVKLSNSFKSGDWYTPIDTINVTSDDINHMLNSICFGDVNGSYIPPAK